MVTVEYHDPSGVFALVQPNLLSRLPLRSLKWKSPTRPLRNIETLHIDFVPDTDDAPHTEPEAQRRNSVRSDQRPGGGGDSLWPAKPDPLPRSVSQPLGGEKSRRRRHQIPGLRETPFLKLFILRCDDKEHYRTTHRQQLRDWVKAISPKTGKDGASASSKQDDHDAYEWMIIHVVIPDTPVANEPRWTAAKNDPDELAERSKSKTKWTSKGSSTVFDKLRADFHPPSKTALERVAQIRLNKKVVPLALMPTDPLAASLPETPQEQENAWNDLIGKFKILILQSFDARVRQYEEDVRAKEVQRALPGWNFCTFFVLKEGLARAFESVGLLEDALAIYDELSVGLDAITKDNTTFLGDMATLRHELVALVNDDDAERELDPRSELSDLLYSPLSISLRDFRHQIVSSNISLFDFHIYIFARQRILIYRLGLFEPQDGALDDMQTPMTAITPLSAVTNGTDKTETIKSEEQLTRVAEVCKRATAFISTNARTLSAELQHSADNLVQQQYDAVVQNVVASWAFNTAEKVLAETSVSLAYAPASTESTPRNGSFAFPQGSNTFPMRRSSLVPVGQDRFARGSVTGNESHTSADEDNVKPAAIGSGLADLAAHRGELSILQRRFLELLASKKGWRAGWAAIQSLTTTVNGHEWGPGSNSETPKHDTSLRFLNEELMLSLMSEEAFNDAYGELTDVALRHLMLGNRTSIVEGLLGDLALLKFRRGDMTGAVQILQKLALKYNSTGWTPIKSAMVWVYTRCLKALHRKDEYIRQSLNLLKRNSDTGHGLADGAITPSGLMTNVNVSLSELVEFSKDLAAPFRAALTDILHNIEVGSAITHDTSKEGFMLSISFESQLNEDLMVDAIKVKLISAGESSHDIWLQSDQRQSISPGRSQLTVATSTTSFGLYMVQQIIFEAGQLHFAMSFEAKKKHLSFSLTDRSVAQTQPVLAGPAVMVYPRAGSPDIRMRLCPEICMGDQRSLHVILEPGDTALKDVLLRLKPATAGLRLHMAEAQIIGKSTSNLGRDSSNALKLSVSAHETLSLKIPFSLELPQTELLIRAEASLRRDGLESVFMFEEDISNDPLIDVDVNDIFKQDNLFSRFSVRTTSGDPLLLHTVDVHASGNYTVECLGALAEVPVFDKQPLSLACRVRRQDSVSSDSAPNIGGGGLRLKIQYSSILKDLTATILSRFRSALEKSIYIKYERFLIPTLRNMLSDQISSSDLENLLLLDRYTIPSCSDLAWNKYTRVLPVSDRAGLLSWLEGWHKQESQIVVSSQDLPHDEQFILTVPVDVPSIEVLASVTLALDGTSSASQSLPQLATVGHHLPATLTIKHTRKWNSSKPPPSSASDSKTSFTYVIAESPDWLVAGRSCATFSAAENEVSAFPLLLIPLVSGVLLLPQIELTLSQSATTSPLSPRPPHNHNSDRDRDSLRSPSSASTTVPSSAASVRTVLDLPQPASAISNVPSPSSNSTTRYACEVDYESAAQTVLVLRAPGDVQYRMVDVPGASGQGPMSPPTMTVSERWAAIAGVGGAVPVRRASGDGMGGDRLSLGTM